MVPVGTEETEEENIHIHVAFNILGPLAGLWQLKSYTQNLAPLSLSYCGHILSPCSKFKLVLVHTFLHNLVSIFCPFSGERRQAPGWHFAYWTVVIFDSPWSVNLWLIHQLKTSQLSREPPCAGSSNSPSHYSLSRHGGNPLFKKKKKLVLCHATGMRWYKNVCSNGVVFTLCISF